MNLMQNRSQTVSFLHRVSILGYIVRLVDGDTAMFSHRGRDVTGRQLIHFNHKSIDKHDDG